MEMSNRVTPAVVSAATGLLQTYCPELSPQSLLAAIRDYQPHPSTGGTFEKPLTRQQTAELLGISLPTVNRLLNRGTLRRIRITTGSIRVDPGTVRALLVPDAGEIMEAGR